MQGEDFGGRINGKLGKRKALKIKEKVSEEQQAQSKGGLETDLEEF